MALGPRAQLDRLRSSRYRPKFQEDFPSLSTHQEYSLLAGLGLLDLLRFDQLRMDLWPDCKARNSADLPFPALEYLDHLEIGQDRLMRPRRDRRPGWRCRHNSWGLRHHHNRLQDWGRSMDHNQPLQDGAAVAVLLQELEPVVEEPGVAAAVLADRGCRRT